MHHQVKARIRDYVCLPDGKAHLKGYTIEMFVTLCMKVECVRTHSKRKQSSALLLLLDK